VRLLAEVQNLHEQNPMLGLRGCRLGLLFPEIIEMQTRAIIEAAVSLKKERIDVRPKSWCRWSERWRSCAGLAR